MTEDIGCENLAKRRLLPQGHVIFTVRLVRGHLRRVCCSHTAQPVLRICDSINQVGTASPYRLRPIDARAAANACIANEGVEMREDFK